MHLALPFLLFAIASAQESPPAAVPADPADPATPPVPDFSEAVPLGVPFTPVVAPAPPPVTRARSTRWAAVGPRGENDFVDVALHPLRKGIWAVVQVDGATWISVDSGASWIEVLEGTGVRFGATSRDEELFMDVQARVDELADSVGDGSAEEMEDAANEAAGAAQDAAAGIQGELDQGLWLDDEQGATRNRTGQVRVTFTAAGMLLVARPDGLRVSPDLGATWVQVLSDPISDAEEVAPGEVLAIGPRGAFVSSDLVQWTSVVLPMPLPPVDLVVDGGVWATGPSGVWRSDGADWSELPSSAVAPFTVRPARSGGGDIPLVVGAPLDIFRADPYDASPDPVLGGPMPDVRDIERAPDGSLLAASINGPYESMDGGRTWEPFTSGLLDPAADAIALRGEEVVLVGRAGVYRLDPLDEVVPLPVGRPTKLPSFISLNALIDTSLNRSELRQKVGSRVVAAMIPQVVVEYYSVQAEGPKWYNDDPAGTLYDINSYWRFQTRLTWAPNRQRTGTSFDAGASDNLSIIVVGDDVVVAGEEAPQVLASKVSRGASKYRGILSGRVTELYRLRVRLLLEEPTSDVRRMVLRELNLAEVDAKLDVLTGGAVSAWLSDPNSVSTR